MSREQEVVSRTEAWLDERWEIVNRLDRPEDINYYEGAVKATEFLGYSWERNEEGKHMLLKC